MQQMQHETTSVNLRFVKHLDEIDERYPSVMLIRHGDRNKIPDGEFGNDVELNEKGWNRSKSLGKSLSANKINGIYVSPIIRCVQTGQAIADGAGISIQIEQSRLLGDPGAFVYDGKLAGKSYLELGFRNFYQQLLDGVPITGNHSIQKGAEILTDFLIRKSQRPGLNIFISHDMIVALYAYAIFEMKYFQDEKWIDYLEGVVFQIVES